MPGPLRHLTPRRPRRPTSSVPGRIRVHAVVVAALVTAFVTVLTIEITGERHGLDVIGRQTAPVVVAGTDLSFALEDMDAQLADVLLVGDQTDLGFTGAQARTIYDQRRVEADQDLQRAAATASEPATAGLVRAVLDGLGRYEALAGRTMLLNQQAPHPAGQPSQATLAEYRQATDLLRTVVVPAVRALTDQHAQALERTYQDRYDRTRAARRWTVVLGGAALAALAVLQVYLTRRFRRLVNPALAAGSVLVAALVVAGTVHAGTEAGDLRTAKKDAFDSILVLQRARAVSYDANADESRYLVDPARAEVYQQSFLDKTQQLAGLDGATVADYDQRLADAVQAYRRDHGTVGWNGLYGAEFRNITFTGERAAAEATLTRYQSYQLDDRHIRQLVAADRLRDAVAFCTGYQPGQSNYDYDQYDRALTALVDINQRAFDINLRDGQHGLAVWTYLPAGTGLVVLGLLLIAVLRRLAEYQ